MPFAFSIAPYNRHFTSFRPCEEVEASSGRVAPLGYARIARGVCTSLEVNGRSCRVGGDAEVRNGEVRNLFERRGIPSTSAPPDAARATFCHLLGRGGDGGLGRATLIGVREAKASWSPSSFPGFSFSQPSILARRFQSNARGSAALK